MVAWLNFVQWKKNEASLVTYNINITVLIFLSKQKCLIEGLISLFAHML